MIGLGVTVFKHSGGGSPAPTLIGKFSSASLVIVGGTTVSTMLDQSGGGNNAVQTGGVAQQPLYTAVDPAFNNHPSLDSGAGTRWLETANPIAFGAFTIMYCGFNDINSPFLYCHGNPYDGNPYHVGATNNSDWLHAHSGSGAPADAQVSVTRGLVTSNFSYREKTSDIHSATPKVYTVRYDGTVGGHILRINSVVQVLNSQTVFGIPSSDPGVSICSAPFGFFATPSNAYPGYPGNFPVGIPPLIATGKYSEWRIWNGALSDADTLTNETDLITTYGVV